MAFQPVANCFELVVRYILHGQTCVNTFYATVDAGDYTAAKAEALLAVFTGWVLDHLLAVLPVEATLSTRTIRGLASVIDFVYDDTNDNGLAADYGTGSEPGNVVLSFKRQSGFSGRSARGRVYLPVPGGSISSDNENQVAGAWPGAALAQLNQLRVELLTEGATEVIVSRFADGEPRTAGWTYPVTSYVAVDLWIDSMRRRLTGRGS